MKEIITKSLAQIVKGDHRAASVFEKYHLDFCCQGKRSLQQACAENDVKVEDVVAELESSVPGTGGENVIDFEKLTLKQLADYIVLTHHSFVRKELPAITAWLQKVAAKHGDRHPEMKKVFALFTAMKESMEQHMQKEELILFPRIKEVETRVDQQEMIHLNTAYLESPVLVMEQEHDHAGALMEEIRQLTGDYIPPPDACTTYRLSLDALKAFGLDLHQHVHLENNILFPKAVALFNVQNQSSLN